MTKKIFFGHLKKKTINLVVIALKLTKITRVCEVNFFSKINFYLLLQQQNTAK